ncbi:hypothetical protein GCM10027030_22670 [Luteococcus sediminum]
MDGQPDPARMGRKSVELQRKLVTMGMAGLRRPSLVVLAALVCTTAGCTVHEAATTKHMDIYLAQFEKHPDQSWPYLDARIAT